MPRISLSFDLFLTRTRANRPPGRKLLTAALLRVFEKTDWRSLINEWHFDYADAETQEDKDSQCVILRLAGDRFVIAKDTSGITGEWRFDYVLLKDNPMEKTMHQWMEHAKNVLVNEVPQLVSLCAKDYGYEEILRQAVLHECEDMPTPNASEFSRNRRAGRPLKATLNRVSNSLGSQGGLF